MMKHTNITLTDEQVQWVLDENPQENTPMPAGWSQDPGDKYSMDYGSSLGCVSAYSDGDDGFPWATLRAATYHDGTVVKAGARELWSNGERVELSVVSKFASGESGKFEVEITVDKATATDLVRALLGKGLVNLTDVLAVKDGE